MLSAALAAFSSLLLGWIWLALVTGWATFSPADPVALTGVRLVLVVALLVVLCLRPVRRLVGRAT